MKLDAGSDRETKWWRTIPALPPLDAALPIVGHSNVGLWTWVQSRTLNLIISSACIFEFNLRLWTQFPSSTLNSSSILIFYTLFRFNMNHVIHPIETPPRLLAGEGGEGVAFSRFKAFYWTQVQSPILKGHTIGKAKGLPASRQGYWK